MLSKAIIFREMKSESGFSFAMASRPFQKLQHYLGPCLVWFAVRRVPFILPHRERVTKADDKYGVKNILPRAEVSKFS